MGRRKTVKPPLELHGYERLGAVATDPAGHAYVIPFTGGVVPSTIGPGDVIGPASATDNAIARFDGTTGKLLQNSTPIVQDDGRISTVTDPSSAQDAATKAYVDAQIAAIPPSSSSSGGGHLHGLMRLLGDGATTTFNLLDFAEYLEHIGVGGSFQDPATFALSSDRSQVVFAAAPAAGAVITAEYVIASV